MRAVQTVIDDGMAHPILVGRGMAIAAKISALGLRMKPGIDVRIVDFEQDKVLFASLLKVADMAHRAVGQHRMRRRGN